MSPGDPSDEIRTRLQALLRQSESDRRSLEQLTVGTDGLTGIAAYDQLIAIVRQALDELEPPH